MTRMCEHLLQTSGHSLREVFDVASPRSQTQCARLRSGDPLESGCSWLSCSDWGHWWDFEGLMYRTVTTSTVTFRNRCLVQFVWIFLCFVRFPASLVFVWLSPDQIIILRTAGQTLISSLQIELRVCMFERCLVSVQQLFSCSFPVSITLFSIFPDGGRSGEGEWDFSTCVLELYFIC